MVLYTHYKLYSKLTLSPLGPAGPGGPCGPRIPGAPFLPASPDWPGLPFVPCWPIFPCGPCLPLGPEGPSEPVEPGWPERPWEWIITILFYIRIFFFICVKAKRRQILVNLLLIVSILLLEKLIQISKGINQQVSTIISVKARCAHGMMELYSLYLIQISP